MSPILLSGIARFGDLPLADEYEQARRRDGLIEGDQDDGSCNSAKATFRGRRGSRQELLLVPLRTELEAAVLRWHPQGNLVCADRVYRGRIDDGLPLWLQEEQKGAILRWYPPDSIGASAKPN